MQKKELQQVFDRDQLSKKTLVEMTLLSTVQHSKPPLLKDPKQCAGQQTQMIAGHSHVRAPELASEREQELGPQQEQEQNPRNE